MRSLLVIGIGVGHPDQLTVQAIAALNQVDVFFVIDKGEVTRELVAVRAEICARHIDGDRYRIVEIPDTDRDRTSPGYRNAVATWYDSTIRLVESIRQRGQLQFDYRVIPGISSVQALAAGHRIVLNGIGEPVLVTTGRRLLAAVESGAPNIVVMLDGDLACRQLIGTGTEIYWGAYLGTPDEVLISGHLDEVIGEISDVRERLRHRKGWIMDTYLLRKIK